MRGVIPYHHTMEQAATRQSNGGISSGRKNPVPNGKGRTHSGRFTKLDPDKLRGGYYTSLELAKWLAQWAIRSPSDKVLEPSCGNGVFLEAAIARMHAVASPDSLIVKNLLGIEIIPAEAKIAWSNVAAQLRQPSHDTVKTGDFFDWWQSSPKFSFDAVIGNPPFIRYQSFPEPHRTRAMKIMAQLGMVPNKLTNIWVPFVAAAAASLRPGGRLALVLPAELLQVSYASQLRSFLADRFSRIDILACNELFFPKAEQEVVLLLADKALPAPSQLNKCRVALTETQTVGEIIRQKPEHLVATAFPKTVRHDAEKWLKYFLTEREIGFMRELRSSAVTTTLRTHAKVDIGVVTGKNDFFVLSSDLVKTLGIQNYTMPIVSRSMQLRGARITRAEWQSIAEKGGRVHLLHLAPLNGGKLPKPLPAYIHRGETNAIHLGYKCSIRDPWYAVPAVWAPDAFVFRQIYDFPRVVLNKAEATSTDTIHRLTCNAKPEHLLSNIYTHLTAASAEIEGRSYGGGVLELEPTEAERLLVPRNLGAAVPLSESDRLIRAGRLEKVLAENDRLVLRGQMGFSKAECGILRDIWTKMRDRRFARRRKPSANLGQPVA